MCNIYKPVCVIQLSWTVDYDERYCTLTYPVVSPDLLRGDGGGFYGPYLVCNGDGRSLGIRPSGVCFGGHQKAAHS